MSPQKPEWFELTENQTPSAGLRKVNKVLPITTIVVAGVLILGGSIFTNANGENQSTSTSASSAEAVTTNASSAPGAVQVTSPATKASNNSVAPTISQSGVPSIAPQTTGRFERDGDDDDHEGRERPRHGEREDGEHGDRERDHDDDDEEDDD